MKLEISLFNLDGDIDQINPANPNKAKGMQIANPKIPVSILIEVTD